MCAVALGVVQSLGFSVELTGCNQSFGPAQAVSPRAGTSGWLLSVCCSCRERIVKRYQPCLWLYYRITSHRSVLGSFRDCRGVFGT